MEKLDTHLCLQTDKLDKAKEGKTVISTSWGWEIEGRGGNLSEMTKYFLNKKL